MLTIFPFRKDYPKLRSPIFGRGTMKGNKHMKTITNIIYLAFALFAFACFAVLPTPNAFGVVPAPDGGYPNQNTAEGEDALFSLTTGEWNTAVGFNALYSNTEGSTNTGVGSNALGFTTTGSANTAIGSGALAFNTT